MILLTKESFPRPEIDHPYVMVITEELCFHVSEWGCPRNCLLPIRVNIPNVIDSAGER